MTKDNLIHSVGGFGGDFSESMFEDLLRNQNFSGAFNAKIWL